MFAKHSHCSFCGTAFAPGQPWPRRCGHCANVSYVNPLPVAVVLVPVGEGVVLIRRGVEPQKGKWALPGGFVNSGETWQQAGAREVLEETGIRVDAQTIREFRVCSAPDDTLLVFGLAARLAENGMPPFEPNEETTERMLVTAPPRDMAFELHRETLARYLASRAEV